MPKGIVAFVDAGIIVVIDTVRRSINDVESVVAALLASGGVACHS